VGGAVLTTKQQFEDFLRDIEPSATTKARARAAHTGMRQFLADHEKFGGVRIKTLLSGSYPRDTAIRPRVINGEESRPDVDIIVITNYELTDSPAKVLKFLYKTIQNGYDECWQQARSIGVSTRTADMDVVPLIQPANTGGLLYIPDRKLEKWLLTNPPGHSEWTAQINQKAGGRFKPLVKLMKWWRRSNPTISKRPKGFMIECMTAECTSYDDGTYGDLFVQTLEEVVNRYAFPVALRVVPTVADPAVSGNNVLASVSFEEFGDFYRQAKEHAELGRDVPGRDDPDKALEGWREIFGERFPAIKRVPTKGLLRDAAAPAGLLFPDRPIVPRTPGGFA